MTDKEIIKALECCPNAETTIDCKTLGCPNALKRECRYILDGDNDSFTDNIITGICKDALGLINRQQAEIERLTINMNAFGLGMKKEKERADTIRAEAIKEFAEGVKKLTERTTFADCWSEGGFLESIDNLVKEMVGEQG